MVHEHQQHVVLRRQCEQPDPQRWLGREREAVPDGGEDPVGQLVLAAGDDGDLRRGRRQHHLVGAVVVLRVDGAQRLVAGGHVGQRGGERGAVEVAAQPQDQRQVVGGVGAVHQVEEPQPLLAERQRHPAGSLARRERFVRAGALGDGGGEPGHRGVVEQRPDGQVGAQRRPCPVHHAGREQ